MNYPQENIKPYNSDEEKGKQVEEMFNNIAPAYDTLNHTLSFGIDKHWRRKAIKFLKAFFTKEDNGCGNRYWRFCHSSV
jgi:Methylase involved in ubiquinone/menaquinone biosynthesis